MRTITGNIKILADQDYASKTLEFILCNKYGNQLSALDVDGQIATKKTVATDTSGNFTVILYETEEAEIPMFYKMVFVENEDIEDIKLFIQSGDSDIDFLNLIFPMPELNMFYEDINGAIVFKDIVFDIFERFFVNENIFINNDEKNLIEEFIKYADNTRDSEIIEKLDQYLATLLPKE
ncbi:hypothetical protein [Halarcobacter anaerophilus]|uniref:Uncharacterized protein n=1 Tax=Halarcobacter anaerophilus TaxID=877500 RepID=A0A4Q0Y5J2_9BACT|nr:hypothetical protein [Halarcobacter anaerophilus]QDF28996.1 hypothetical protein AANAER_1516 [Halarcobacter anaerophilus]RXJ63631.1 hypothetical protein CRV06_05405 [Halarcobacter anaerophilus]